MDDPLQVGALAKRTEAVLREARSLLRRVGKVDAAAREIDDQPTVELVSTISGDVEALVRHLERLEGRRTRRSRRSR